MSVSPKWTGERIIPSVLNEIAVEHISRYAFCLQLATGKKVLDVACGEGYGSNLLAVYARAVTGVDIDEKTISYAQQKYNSANLEFIRASVLKLPFQDKSFDIIVSFETIEHISEHEEMITEIIRVLKQDGLLIISTPNKKVYLGNSTKPNPYHKKELDKETFTNLLKSSFSNVEILHQQNMYGSFIYPEREIGNCIKEMKGTFDTIASNNKLSLPPYFVAVATNAVLPTNAPLFFHSANVYEKELEEFKKTWTYKIGAVITAPLKWMTNKLGK